MENETTKIEENEGTKIEGNDRTNKDRTDTKKLVQPKLPKPSLHLLKSNSNTNNLLDDLNLVNVTNSPEV